MSRAFAITVTPRTSLLFMESRHFVEGFNFTSKGRDVIDAMLVILLMERIYDWSFEHPKSLLHEVIF